MDRSIEKELAAEVLAARASGCPVAFPDHADETANAARRRWESFSRRRSRGPSDHEARVEDLAKGLRDHFEPDRELVGPVMKDYRDLARRLARVLDE